MEWISVNDRLPEVFGRKCEFISDLCESAPVLVITEYGDMMVAQYETETDDETGKPTCLWNIKGVDTVDGVTHWMPLPEPPK